MIISITAIAFYFESLIVQTDAFNLESFQQNIDKLNCRYFYIHSYKYDTFRLL